MMKRLCIFIAMEKKLGMGACCELHCTVALLCPLAPFHSFMFIVRITLLLRRRNS